MPRGKHGILRVTDQAENSNPEAAEGIVMFTVTEKDIRIVLDDYGIQVENLTFTELERYNYDEEDPQTKQVRVIVKADLSNDHALVLRFKNEDDAPQEIIEVRAVLQLCCMSMVSKRRKCIPPLMGILRNAIQ